MAEGRPGAGGGLSGPAGAGFDIRRRQQVMSREEERQEERGLKALRAVWNRSRERGARSLEEQMAVFDQAERQRQEELRQQEEAFGRGAGPGPGLDGGDSGGGPGAAAVSGGFDPESGVGSVPFGPSGIRYFAFRHLLLVREREEELRRQLQGRQL